jgi:phage terminase large subunit
MKRQGFKIEAEDKRSGSVEDGVTYMKKFKQIVIHPDCPETAREFKLYSYKVNRAVDVLPEILDLNNHHMDGIRYGLQPLIKGRSSKKPAGAGSRTY